MPIDGILIGKHALGQSFADDYDRLVVIAVGIVEIPAGFPYVSYCAILGCFAQIRISFLAQSVNQPGTHKIQVSVSLGQVARRSSIWR
jgi:hypothetical protein